MVQKKHPCPVSSATFHNNSLVLKGSAFTSVNNGIIKKFVVVLHTCRLCHPSMIEMCAMLCWERTHWHMVALMEMSMTFNWKDCERKWSWSNLRYYQLICQEGLQKPSESSWSVGRDYSKVTPWLNWSALVVRLSCLVNGTTAAATKQQQQRWWQQKQRQVYKTVHWISTL